MQRLQGWGLRERGQARGVRTIMAAPEVRFLQGDEIERMTRGELQALAKAHE